MQRYARANPTTVASGTDHLARRTRRARRATIHPLLAAPNQPLVPDERGSPGDGVRGGVCKHGRAPDRGRSVTSPAAYRAKTAWSSIPMRADRESRSAAVGPVERLERRNVETNATRPRAALFERIDATRRANPATCHEPPPSRCCRFQSVWRASIAVRCFATASPECANGTGERRAISTYLDRSK